MEDVSLRICTMLGQRQKRWADVVQMLYKYFVFVAVARLLTVLECFKKREFV